MVVNFGVHDLVEVNLVRSLGHDFPGSVVVVDCWYDDEERSAIVDVCDRHGWSCLPLPSNAGFGGGVNRGAEVAVRSGASELLVVNPDAWIDIESIRRLHARVRAEPRTLVAPRVLRPNGTLYSDENDLYLDTGAMLWRRLRDGGTPASRIHTWVSGACFLISARLWGASGGFDEDYFLYWEDVDLSRRITLAGGGVEVVQSVCAVHDEGSTQRDERGSRQKSPAYYYYNARNRLVYAAKHLPREDQRRWLMATPRTTYGFAKQGGRRQLAHPSRNLWPALRGARDGVRYLRSSRR